MELAQVRTRPVNRYLALLSEIDRAFDFFNDHFQSNLTKPIIIVSPDYGHSMSGWFGIKKWVCSGQYVHEINLNANIPRGSYALLETLLHEMAHLKNHQNGIDDVDLDTQYHNIEYKIAAQSFGLKVRKGSRYGFAFTTLGPQAINAIQLLSPDDSVFDLYRKME